VGVATIIDTMRKNRPGWFNHIMRRGDSEELRVAMEINAEDKRGRDRPNNRWIDRIENDTKVAVVTR